MYVKCYVPLYKLAEQIVKVFSHQKLLEAFAPETYTMP
jgi:hypothetical protein